jgi:site-specific DNA recombinase
MERAMMAEGSVSATRMVGYVRVSSEEQARSGLSLESQEQKIRAMAAVKGVDLVEIVTDAGESAKSLNRPGVKRIIDMVNSGEVAGVIVAKLDRLTRNVRDLADLVEMFNRTDAALVSVGETLDTGSAVGRMMMNVIATISQWEREVIAERTTDALRVKKLRGELTGNAPYGYRVINSEEMRDGKPVRILVEDDREQEIIALVHQARAGGMYLRQIAQALNDRGYVTRRGAPWRLQYLPNLLEEKAA